MSPANGRTSFHPFGAMTMSQLRKLPKSTVKAVLLLALPVLAEQLLAVGVGLVDTWLTGNFLPGDRYLAAIGQIAYLLWLIPNLFSFVSVGATALVSRFTGSEDGAMANRATNQAFLLGGLLSAVVTLWLSVGSEWLIRILKLPPEAAELALVYLRYLVPVIPAIMLERVAIACLQGAGDTVSGMVVRVVVNVCNVLLSIALVVGWGPLPAMGWGGIALGTAISHVVGASILVGVLLRGRVGLRIRPRQLTYDHDLSMRLLRVGIPGGIDVLLILFCHLWFLALINQLGTAQAAAHSLGIRIESLGYLPGAAFQVAAITLAGQYLGAKDSTRAGRSVLISVLLGGGVMVAAGISFYFGGFAWASFFTGNANSATAAQAAFLLKIAAFAMPTLAVSMIVSGALRGAGDTRWPMLINMIGMLGVRVPGTYLAMGPLAGWASTLAANANDGILRAAWLMMFVDLAVRAVLVSLRFFHGGWKDTKV